MIVLLLRIKDLTKHFGGIIALNRVGFGIKKGEIVGLIGPNGSGKTTLLDTVCNFLEKDGGEVYYKEEDITKCKPNEIATKGIGRTFQVARVFRNMTVLENLFAVPVKGSSQKDKAKRVKELLELVGLTPVMYEYAGNISGGQQKLTELSRTLMLDPDLMMMDEPFAGIDPAMLNTLVRLIDKLNKEMGKTFLIVEHNMPLVFRLCSRVIVLNEGEVLTTGQPEDIQNDRRVIEAYLGE
jgi:ABC-type branched-subunit amino acid transport system ATPase component